MVKKLTVLLSTISSSKLFLLKNVSNFCKIAFFPFLLVALMVCIVMFVIRMPNGGVCPIQVVRQDADMAENINFNG